MESNCGPPRAMGRSNRGRREGDHAPWPACDRGIADALLTEGGHRAERSQKTFGDACVRIPSMPRSAPTIALLVLGLILAGCTGYDAAPGESETRNACELHHEVGDGEEYGGYQGEELTFGTLSERGQHVFSKALETGNYSITYDGTNKPPDFSYSDQTTIYEVNYRGEQYVLTTYTDTGCVIEHP